MPTDFENSIVSLPLKIVAAHWLAARRGCEVPAWAALMPSAIKAELPIVWSYTYDSASDTFIGRLAGDRVAAIFGRNFHGLPMSEVQPKERYPILFAKCKKVLTVPALYLGSGIIFNTGGKSVGGEQIIMPLSSDGHSCDGVFGATALPPFFHEQMPQMKFDAEVEHWFLASGAAENV
jgi:hypothetical protein